MARRISYEVVERKPGKFDAVKWTEWPDLDQRIHAPIPVRLNTYPTRKAAAAACRHDADWQAIVDADAGHVSEIVCDEAELAQPDNRFEERDEAPLVKPQPPSVKAGCYDI